MGTLPLDRDVPGGVEGAADHPSAAEVVKTCLRERCADLRAAKRRALEQQAAKQSWSQEYAGFRSEVVNCQERFAKLESDQALGCAIPLCRRRPFKSLVQREWRSGVVLKTR